MMLVLQQAVIGLALGFAVTLVFVAVEFAGEIIGLDGIERVGEGQPVGQQVDAHEARILSAVTLGHRGGDEVDHLVADGVAPVRRDKSLRVHR